MFDDTHWLIVKLIEILDSENFIPKGILIRLVGLNFENEINYLLERFLLRGLIDVEKDAVGFDTIRLINLGELRLKREEFSPKQYEFIMLFINKVGH